LFVVHPGKDSYEMNDKTEAVAITHLRARLSQLGMGGEQTGCGALDRVLGK
jgi:Cu/Zn superoxide dismutase